MNHKPPRGWKASIQETGFKNERDQAVQCESCSWEGTTPGCEPISAGAIHSRVSAGEIMPVGECPVCGCNVHFTDLQVAYRIRPSAIQQLADIAPKTPQQ
jgi:hypothetical protein